jgi:NAD(P)-dependent dehydrogenase (short-subunit alcohol dehydrogenase family)
MAELEGRAALITGGTTGLGFEIARRFLEEGASVVLTGRDEILGATAEEQLASLGAAKFIRADAGDPDQARASVDQAVGLLGGLDILVNNAGVGVQAGVLETPLDSYDLVMDVNVRGAFVYAQAAFPHLEARGGAMLHVASDAGVMGEEDIGIYSVSKAALVMLSNMLAIEGGRRGVRSNAVCPGDTAPGMRHMGPPGHDRPEDDPEGWIVPPLGRVGLAIDVAEAAVYLCSPRAAFVNGVALLVDGGMRAGMRTDRPAGP